VERRRAEPMLDLALFRSRSFSGIMLCALLLNGAAFAGTVYVSLWLQSVLGLTPLQGGLVFIPLSLLSFGVAGGAGRWLQTLPPRVALGGGLVIVGVASFLLALVNGGASWTILVPGLAVLGVGVGMANPVLASAALAAVPRERSGMASGAVNTARQLGFALGVAVLGSVFTTRASSVLAAGQVPDPSGTASALVAGQAGRVIGTAPAPARAGLADLLGGAYADGLRWIFLTCGAAGIIGGLVVLFLVDAAAPHHGGPPAQGQRPAGEPEAEPAGAR
jgi:predicted MFS family arabinose efflux permease